MIKMEVNLDDISGEWLGYVMDMLFNAGANDVFYTPIYMKKNRPGVLLQLLCREEAIEEMKEILLRETTTLGIRYYPLTVHRMERVFTKVDTKWGPVTVKQGVRNGEVFQSSPEYEECRKIAETHDIPFADKGGVAFTAFSACTAILASGISGALQRKRPVVILLSVQLYLLADRGGILVEQPGDRSLIGIIDDAFLDDLPIGKAEVLVVRHSFILS